MYTSLAITDNILYVYTYGLPHVVVFLKQSVVFHCPLLEFHVNAAAVDADDAPNATTREGQGRENQAEARAILVFAVSAM